MAAITPSCHESADGRSAPAGSPVIAVVGAPNGGKSTLFNRLTGARRMMGNWPGTSVEIGRGTWKADGQALDAIDFPGAYSLDAQSPDEELTRDLLLRSEDRPDLVLVVVSAAAAARSLYLLSQLREHPYRIVVALTMGDVAATHGLRIDPAALAAGVGCPVVAVDPRTGAGIEQLTRAVVASLDEPVPASRLSGEVCCPADAGAVADPTVGPEPSGTTLPATDPAPTATGPVPTTTGPAPTTTGPAPSAELDEFARAEERFTWIDAALTAAQRHDETPRRRPFAARIDAVLLHPVAGPLIFLAVMWAVFQLTTTVAAPLQDALDALFSGPVTDGATALLAALGLGTPAVTGFVTGGLIAGVGTVLTFVPLMAIMFVLLALLEDSGYMARAAVVADRLMRAIGLPGKAFLPLIVGFGCNVPAISATRVLSDAKQRILTALLIPFTSCSARLTVYVMLARTFFPDSAGTVVFAMYLASILLVVLAGLALRSTLWRTMGSSALVIDLPSYQVPTVRLIAQVTWMRLRGFLQTAGGIIVLTVIAVWALQAIPVIGQHTFAEVPPDDSLYAAVSGALAPLFAPAGFADWRTVGALITGFLAKEAVISSWAQTYAVPDPSADAPATQGVSDLAHQLQATFEASSGGHPQIAVVAFMVFLLAYTPCVATLAAQKREIGTGWTVFGLVLQLGVAYLLAVAVFQLGSLIW